MSEAAAAMGRKDADRWLAKAVIEVVAAERPGAERGEQPGSLFTPRTTRQPPPGEAPGPQPPGGQPGGGGRHRHAR
jgi:hypothetical protein